MNDWLKKEWIDLLSKYVENSSVTENLWQEIEHQYTLKIRHYHNLSHVYNMLQQAKELKTVIDDYDTLRWSIWYHDIIYKPTRKDNEEKSAILAENRLKSIHFDSKRIEKVKNLINSTKNHKVILTENNDNSYLLDVDLSILGTHWNSYKNYVDSIRKEYAIYPSFMYKKGRKKVLEHFLERETLFYTKDYISRFENQARENLKKEIESLK